MQTIEIISVFTTFANCICFPCIRFYHKRKKNYCFTKPYKMKKIVKKFRKKLKATLNFSKAFALRHTKIEYYKAQQEEIRNLPLKDKIKAKYSTTKKNDITKKLNLVKLNFNKRSQRISSVWSVLDKIYKKRSKSECPINDLMSILSNENFLLVCYKKVRRNKGANTPATLTPTSMKKDKNKTQKRLLDDFYFTPDGISLKMIKTVSELIKKNEYPWGISRRIMVESPPGKMRPITIPPFMDKVVQEGIKTILISIYEPIFEKINRSFAFRPNKGVHDAMYGIQRKNNANLNMAIEGDIKGAYNKVSKKILLDTLRETIKDTKFINFIKNRLQYIYYDTLTKKFNKEKEGIPQGGIDSPYLWNIYMLKFDRFVTEYMNNLVNEMNKIRNKGNSDDKRIIVSKETLKLINIRRTVAGYIDNLRKDDLFVKRRFYGALKYIENHAKVTLEMDYTKENVIIVIRKLIALKKFLQSKIMKMEYSKPKRDFIRFHYTRYADDFIILGNYNKKIAEKIREAIRVFLRDQLKATLSMEKTLITDIFYKNCLFLGFSLRILKEDKIIKRVVLQKKGIIHRGIKKDIIQKLSFKQRANTKNIRLSIDNQRRLNKMHLLHYCNKYGVPTSIPWLTNLETFTIIERFNSVMRGLCNYYIGFIKNKSDIYRYLYILRYSCYKTIARKYNISIRKVMKRFKYKDTIACEVTHTIADKSGIEKRYLKRWVLLTNKSLIQEALEINLFERSKKIFEDLEMGIGVKYPQKSSVPTVTNKDFLENINWVNMRTKPNLSMSCYKCGSPNNIEMHHIKGIRLTKLSDIPEHEYWTKIMSLRGRNQIPLCRSCHMKVHNRLLIIGKNDRPPIFTETKRGYDNRLVNIENYLNKTGFPFFSKTLEEKGWKQFA
uniref:Putative HNH endonuclease n=1 Tax=Haematococcus lacustris TaxID=44745 RepID=A0A0S2IE99_HAELA|nr:putative HNH endonuclease [Haematococcus lacustris]